MGRDAGFIALSSAVASGAESVLVPEETTDILELVNNIKNQGKHSSIVLVAEGDDAGHAIDIMNKVKPYLKEYELRISVLGHIQRGGSPSAKDRIVATRMGNFAVELLIENKTNLTVGINGDILKTCSISEAIKQHTMPDMAFLKLIEVLRTK
jgi:6-phosphofructokinase 1